MKRMIALLLIAAVLFTLAACGKKESKSDALQDSAQAASQAAQSAEAAAQAETAVPEQAAPSEDEGNTLTTDSGTLDDSALESLNASTGANLSRPTVIPIDSESCEIVEENGVQIAQYTFLSGSVAGGVRYCPDTNADISGVTDENGAGPFTDGAEETVNLGGALMARWFAPNGQYVMIATTEDEEQFNRLVEEMKALTAS